MSDWRGALGSTLEARDARDDRNRDRDTSTSNETDLRRARQHTRAVVADLQDDIEQFLEQQGQTVSRLPESATTQQQVNEQITRLAQVKLATDLVAWLAERRIQTMGRAARESFARLKQTVDRVVDDSEIRTQPYVQTADQRINRLVSQIDVGLYERLSRDAGDTITRQLRFGVRNGESTAELAQRVKWVLSLADDPKRNEAGVSGQTIQSRAELIAHDSVQHAYNAAATRRYLANGFRYVVYDATLDLKTTDLCRRLDGVVIDIIEHPELLPGNHPWCRSGIRPKLMLDPGEEPISREDIADSYLGAIARTNSFRPPVLDAQELYQPTSFTDA